jgi:hypothetical protein
MKLTVEQRLEKATANILAHKSKKYVGLTGLLLYGDVTVSDTMSTACTDGKNEIYGRSFVEGLTDAELRFVRLHECYHKMYRHLLIWQHLWKEDKQLANEACDYVINIKLVDGDDSEGFITMPKCGLLDEQYRGMDAGQVFKLRKKEKEEREKGKCGGDGKGGAGQPGDTGEAGQPGDTGGVGQPKDTGSGDTDEGFDSHDWEAASKLTKEEATQVAREIDDALRQGNILAGKAGSGGLRDIKDLLQSKVDWREALREFINQSMSGDEYSSWRRFHRRGIALEQYLPAGFKDTVHELLIGIDTSGSIGSKEIGQFLGEVKGVCETLRPERIRLLYWDTAVCREEVYLADQLDNLIRTTKPEGGGGTDPSCVVRYMEKNTLKPECVVMLTDGYVGSWGTWSVPVLWCITNNKAASPSVGKSVHVNF